MINKEQATTFEKCVYPWVFDRIEVIASVFTAPMSGTYHNAVFGRPTEPVRYSLLGTWYCEFQSGPNLVTLANHCAKITGYGFYGIAQLRRFDD